LKKAKTITQVVQLTHTASQTYLSDTLAQRTCFSGVCRGEALTEELQRFDALRKREQSLIGVCVLNYQFRFAIYGKDNWFTGSLHTRDEVGRLALEIAQRINVFRQSHGGPRIL
jgi:hypothetical protein